MSVHNIAVANPVTDPPVRPRLEIHPLSIVSGKRTLNVKHIRLRAGEIYNVFGKSNTLVRELLYAIAGLELSLQQSLRPIGEGLAPPPPDIVGSFSDHVLLNGERLYLMDDVARAQHVGFIFENPEWGFLCNSVSEDFLFSFYAACVKPPPIYQLRDYGLYEVRFQTPETLSGGEQQRLACAGIIERSPGLVIADFSSSNLDAGFRADVLVPWVKASAALGTTFVTRGLSDQELAFDGAIVVGQGEAKLGTPDRNDFPLEVQRIRSIRSAFGPREVKPAPVLLSASDAETSRGKAPISFDLRPGEVKIVTGPNGSGKTSFGRAVLGRLPVTKGTLHIHDDAQPAMAFQNPEHCLFSGRISDEIQNRALLDLCKLDQKAWGIQPLSLPRSKQKLVSIVAACEMSGGLVILDEPTVGLDFQDEIQLQRILSYYKDKAFLIFSHDDALKQLDGLPGAETLDISRKANVRW